MLVFFGTHFLSETQCRMLDHWCTIDSGLTEWIPAEKENDISGIATRRRIVVILEIEVKNAPNEKGHCLIFPVFMIA